MSNIIYNGGGQFRRRLMMSQSQSIKTINGNVGDAVFFTGDDFIAIPYNEISYVSGWTPIGVVVIPTSHDVYGTSECGVMSLAEMCSYPSNTGTSSWDYLYWGGYGTDTSLINYNVVNLVNGTTKTYGYLPSDQFTGDTSLDGVSKYSSPYNQAPSPYNADGSRNDAYYTTAYASNNAFSDFDGVGNTKVLTDLATAQSGWKTTSTIINSYDVGYYPAACCCWRFHTAGTNQGQWYLPACGEFGYVINRLNAINETINKVRSVYPSIVAVTVSTTNIYLSSSEYTAYNSRVLDTLEGGVSSAGKDYSRISVRAFLRLI